MVRADVICDGRADFEVLLEDVSRLVAGDFLL